MKQNMYLGMRLVHVDIDYMQVFRKLNNVGIMINAYVNAKNWLTKVNVVMDLLGILPYMNPNVIHHSS